MDFSFNVNDLLRDEITCLDSRLLPCRQQGVDRHGFRQLQTMLYEIVDKMGEASAKAQGLPAAITSGKKLELAEHRLYIMTDGNGNRANGSVLGILKMGTKKLFVYDHSKVQHELEPLCVLDFYVHESRQRMGCGRKLFDFMLRAEGVPAQHLAIDRPSEKFLSFLSKHYKLRATIPQVNNFVIFEGFFNNRSDLGNSRNRRRGGGQFGVDQRKPSPFRPPSGQRRPHVAQYESNPAHSHINSHSRSPVEEHFSKSVLNNWVAPNAGRQQPSHMGAGEMMYSRHGPSPTGGYHNNSPTPTAGVQSQGAMSANSGMYFKKLNGLSSPHTYYNMGMSPGNFPGFSDSLPPTHPHQRQGGTPRQDMSNSNVTRIVGGAASTPNFGNRSGGGSSLPDYSHSQPGNTKVTQPAPVVDPRYPSTQTKPAPPPAQLPDIAANQQTISVTPMSVNIGHRPPSGKRNHTGNRTDPGNPPLLQRDGPPVQYAQMLNTHQTYQGRNGHLAVPQGKPSLAVQDLSPAKPVSQNTSWTVMGVLRDQKLNSTMSNRYYNSNRLW